MYSMRQLGDFVSLRQGLAINKGTNHLISNKKDSNFVYPLLRIADMMEDKFDRYVSKDVNPSVIAKPEDIVYTRTGQIGLVFKNYLGCVHNNSFIVTLESDEITKDYLYTMLSSSFVRNQALKLAKNSVQPDLTHDMFKSIVIPVPSKVEQERISKLYLTLISKQESNITAYKIMESMTKLLYDYWFIQYDFPNSDGKPYKSSGGELIWNEKVKKSIPLNWEVKTVKECIQHIKTGLNPRDNFVLGSGSIKYITVKNLTTMGTIDFTDCDTIDDEARNIVHTRSDIDLDDILFASIAPLGRCVVIKEKPKDWDINESIFTIRPNYKVVTSEYLYSFFMSEYFIKKAESNSTGSIFSGLRMRDLENLYIVVPSKDIIDKYSEFVSEILELKYKKEKENSLIDIYESYIMPLLMNGQIKIED